jgi:hypothetical protein
MSNETRFRIGSTGVRIALRPLLIGAGLIGCGSPSPESAPLTSPPSGAPTAEAPVATSPAPDPDDVPIKENDVARPKDYAEAVSRIEGYRDQIRDEIAAGRPTKAHRGLDELDIVLEWLPAIARDSGVPKEQWEKINLTAKEIQGLFNQVHSRIDAKQEPDYAAVSSAIDAAIGELKTLSAMPKAAEPEKKP